VTATLHDHIHLFAYTNETELDVYEQAASAYSLLMPGMDVKLDTAAVVERGLTGVPHVYHTDGDSGPLLFQNGTLSIMATWPEVETLMALSGKPCYLILNVHDDDSGGACPVDTTNGYHCLAVVTTYRMIDPGLVWWTVFVNITDLT
jgi:hypothetical protein